MMTTDELGSLASTADARWLLLHGVPFAPSIWDEVAERLPGSVFAPDVMPASDELLSPQQAVARRVVSELRAMGPERWRIVGHSFGGQVALDMALLAPDVVEGLTIVCSRDTPYPAFEAAAEVVADTGKPVDVDAALRRWFRPEEFAAGHAVIDRVGGYLAAADRASWAAALLGIAGYDRSSRTTGIAAPATVIAAEHDAVSDPTTMAAMAGRLLKSSFTVLADTAHMSAFLHPADFARVITGDLARRWPRRPGTI